MKKRIDAEEIRKLNDQDRMWFVEYWAKFVRNNPDEVWSKQQNVLINSMMQNAKQCSLTPEEYLKIKGESGKRVKTSTL